jgi:hypothetical protein
VDSARAAADALGGMIPEKWHRADLKLSLAALAKLLDAVDMMQKRRGA